MTARSLARAGRILLAGSSYVFFFLGGVLLSYAVLPLVRAAAPGPDPAARRSRALLGRAWALFHWYMRVCGLIDYDPRATRLGLPAGPFVLVANHPTLVDVTALLAAYPDVVSVAKSSMWRSPLVGRLLRYCGHVDAGDGSPFSGVGAATEVLERLRAGTPVLLFPEGTRSPARAVGPFHPGAFEIAARAGVPLVAALIRCDPPALMRGQRWYEIPETTALMTISHLCTRRPPFEAPDEGARALRAAYVERLGAPGSGVDDARVAAGSTTR